MYLIDGRFIKGESGVGGGGLEREKGTGIGALYFYLCLFEVYPEQVLGRVAGRVDGRLSFLSLFVRRF